MEIKNNDGNYWIKSREVEGLFHELSMEMMKNIVRRLKQRGTVDLIDNPYVWQLEKLNDMHLITEENVKLISKYSGVAEEVFRDVIANEGFKIYQDSHQQLAQALKSDATPNPLVQDSLNSLAKQTMFEVNNLINTTMPKALQKNYKQTLESAVAGVVSGTKSHEKALSEAVLKMYERGFTAFRDRGGRMWTVERYAKTVIRTTTFRTYREMRERPADDLGIDIFSEICYGAKSTIILSCSSALFAAVGGSIIGMVAGYFGGIFDEILLGIIDFFISVPDLLLMVVLGTFLGPSLKNIIFSIVLVSWIMPAKITRSQILRMKQENYIKIAKIYGAGFIHLFLWHFWKPFFSIIMMSVIKLMNRAILAEAALSYLGLGDPLSKSWGMIITRAMDFPNIYLTEFWKWWLAYPVIFMVLMVLSIAIIGQKIERKIVLGHT